MSDVVGTTGALLDVAADIQADWSRAGLGGGFMARNLADGAQLGFGVDRSLPLASVVKAPQALVLFDRIDHGHLDPRESILIDPHQRTPGPTGLSLFKHPSTVAVEDLITTSLAVSDNAAADALFGLVSPAQVTEQLHAWGHLDIVVRHQIRAIYEAMAEVPDASVGQWHELAVRATTRGGGHVIPQLDSSQANAGTAKALVAFLEDVWTDAISTPTATAALRTAMGHQMTRHRLGAEVVSDLTELRAKTGTFLNLRHEVGVITTDAGDEIAVAALSVSSVPVQQQPEADAAIGAAARSALEALVP